jgi:hypothetical protein
MRNPRNQTLCLFASFGVAAFAFTPTIRVFCRSSASCAVVPGCSRPQSSSKSKIRLYESSVEKESSDQLSEAKSNAATNTAVQEVYPKAEIMTMTLTKHRPLGCTVEESIDTENDPTVVFVSKVVEGGNAENAGVEVGDVLIGVTGFFGEMTPVWQSGVEKM